MDFRVLVMNIKAHLGFVLIDIDGILIPCEPEDSMRSFGSTSTSTAGLNKDEEQCVKRHITEETVTNLLLGYYLFLRWFCFHFFFHYAVLISFWHFSKVWCRSVRLCSQAHLVLAVRWHMLDLFWHKPYKKCIENIFKTYAGNLVSYMMSIHCCLLFV